MWFFALVVALHSFMILPDEKLEGGGAKLTVCPTSHYEVRFPSSDSAQLDNDAMATIHAAAARARMCYVESFVILVLGDLGEIPVVQQRVESLRRELVASGMDAALIEARRPTAAEMANGLEPTEDVLVGVIYFR